MPDTLLLGFRVPEHHASVIIFTVVLRFKGELLGKTVIGVVIVVAVAVVHGIGNEAGDGAPQYGCTHAHRRSGDGRRG